QSVREHVQLRNFGTSSEIKVLPGRVRHRLDSVRRARDGLPLQAPIRAQKGRGNSSESDAERDLQSPALGDVSNGLSVPAPGLILRRRPYHVGLGLSAPR